jgi:hypothetical protein
VVKNRAFGSIWEINVDKCGYLKVHDFTDRCPKKCTILPIDSAYHYASLSPLLLYRRNSSYRGSMAVIRRKQNGGTYDMMTILLTIVAVYVAIGIAVVITTNYAFVQKGGRLRTIRDSVPLVLAWPVVVYVLWAFSRG